MPAHNVVITGNWIIHEHTITFNYNGGTGEPASITQNYGTVITAPATPTKEGHTFAGWQPSIPATMPDEDLVVVAQWTINQYTITFDSN
jgi:hypothetical protein